VRRVTRYRLSFLVPALLAVLLLPFVGGASAGLASPSETCTSPNCPITINDNPSAPATQDQAASPYPSVIGDLGGSGDTIEKVTVTLNGLTHSALDNLDVLLVREMGSIGFPSSTSVEVVELMSDAGGALPVANLNLTFDDSAATSVPQGSPPASGTYKPTNYPGGTPSLCAADNPPASATGDPFPAPAPPKPPGGYAQTLDVFTDTKYGGTWRLYVGDDCLGGSGSIASWSVNLTLRPYNGVTLNKWADAATVTSGSPIGFTLSAFNCQPSACPGSVYIDDPLPSGPGIVWEIDPPNPDCSLTGAPPSQTLGCAFFVYPVEGAESPHAPEVHVSSATSGASCGKYTNIAEAYGFNAPPPGSPARAKAWTTVVCPTVARVLSLAASHSARGVLLRWRASSEIDTLGFNVYRGQNGRRVRLNRALIPSRTDGGHAYSWLDRRVPRYGQIRYWLQVVSLDGRRSWYGPQPAR
jgi:hypothetical protein